MSELKATKFSVTSSGVATIMLSRPEALNALNMDLNVGEIAHNLIALQASCSTAAEICTVCAVIT